MLTTRDLGRVVSTYSGRRRVDPEGGVARSDNYNHASRRGIGAIVLGSMFFGLLEGCAWV
jgi:hypothetical protein